MSVENILVLNAGSATLKYAVYGSVREASPGTCLLRGQVELAAGGGEEAVRDALRDIARELNPFAIGAVGHRIVHGGAKFVASALIDDGVVAELRALQPLAPLHQALGLAVVAAARAERPLVPHVAAFDTAFHASMPMVAQRFALPQVWFDRGVRRFGFHGLSYEFIASRLDQLDVSEPTRRVVVAHLGGGASLCALRGGRSVATTMSFTPTDGLVMSTRSGALDPGAVLFLVREHRMDVDAVEHLLNLESGLLGVSGVSGDMRALLENREPAAQLAVDLFVHRIVMETGAMVAALGGVDAIVFTGGIGTHQPRIRSRICDALAWLGIHADPALNQRGQMRFDSPRSAVGLWNIPTDEEGVIAAHTARLVSGMNNEQ
ncbi:MAG TPA: acetate/propionate family kinase [Pseudomonadales bacterium]|nr:acetate/propionate family kinase [Pseudomonadales bacterium]